MTSFFAWTLIVLRCAAFIAGVYVAMHFIIKYW